MILWSQWEDLLNILLVSKFEMNRPNVKLIINNILWHMALSGLKEGVDCTVSSKKQR